MYKQVALVILDGWGLSDETRGNALSGNMPILTQLLASHPSARLACSGTAVGLMEGQMGDSNVGHLNIGAGRVVYQDLVRIQAALSRGELRHHPEWVRLCRALQSRGGRLHLFGLLSDGGVHSHIDHLKAVLQECKLAALEVYLHLQLDGRDVSPTSGVAFLRDMENFLGELGCGQIATVMGRYYGMDRDKRWERTALAFGAMTAGVGESVALASSAVDAKYAAGITDEFIPPMLLAGSGQHGLLRDGDGVLCFNFRADRMRQIVQSIGEREVSILTFTRYHEDFAYPYLFAPQDLYSTLGEVVSHAGFKQLRMAETEKYAHVTFFLNGGTETPYLGEDRILIPSPKVATYDLAPAMSAPKLAEAFVEKVKEGYQLMVLNFANLDMVGHTGVYEAACTAAKAVDVALGQVVSAVLAEGGALVITADHGNAESMQNEQGQPLTAHTLNEVACVVVSPFHTVSLRTTGVLADVAPTVLALLGLEQPAAMTGESLIMGGTME
ncbi:MAG: 2,3-bisphosphoglycerate-independent phosphoglycerate mutase [Firmicutes bacterium]|nr:2,3-bisphosphoglycerate-independent phosphoglycerate mutase [candidate division NPL-UPA2 bacterium]